MNNKRFTLIEALIVVAIIGMLISILLPSLAKAREKARRSVCLSNLTQAHILNAVYAQNNNNKFPLGNGAIDKRIHIVSTYSIQHQQPFGAAFPYYTNYINTVDHLYCPSWEHPNMQKNTIFPNGKWGGYTDDPTDIQPTRHYAISYGYRSQFPDGRRSPAKASDDSGVPYFADHWTDEWGQYVHKQDGYNVLYVDGHAKFNYDKGQKAISDSTKGSAWALQSIRWDLYFKD